MIPGLLLASIQAVAASAAPTEHFGLRLASIGDVDGDGVPDFAVADCSRHESDHGPGRVWVFSGRDARVVVVLQSGQDPSRRPARFGFSLAALGDVDGDRVADFAVGAYADNLLRENRPTDLPGFVRIYSGRTRGVLWQVDGERLGNGFARSLATAGDVNRDGTPDLLVASGAMRRSSRGGGAVRVLSGKNGAILTAIEQPRDSLLDALFAAEPWRGFGWSVSGLGDLDADGVPDFAVGVPFSDTWREKGRLLVHSGSNGERIYSVRRGEGRGWVGLGGAIVPLEDLDQDGVCDFAVSQVEECIWLCSGSDGSTIRQIDDPGRYSYLRGFGDSLTALGDVNGDGIGDIAVGCEEWPDAGDHYDVCVFSGADGSLVRRLASGNQFTVVAAAGDLNADLVPDLLVGRWEKDVVDVYSGKTWDLLRTIQRPSPRR